MVLLKEEGVLELKGFESFACGFLYRIYSLAEFYWVFPGTPVSSTWKNDKVQNFNNTGYW